MATIIIKTVEPCPVCQNPEMTVEHGIKDMWGNNVHIEHCPDCGTHTPVVCYRCEACEAAQRGEVLTPTLPGLS